MNPGFKESAHVFGDNHCLLGVVTEPWPALNKKDLGILLLNAGLLHHVGPNRLWVDLARIIAEMGGTSLRFDLSGLGDSLSRNDSLSYEDRSVKDIQEAMTFLQKRTNLTKFILLGFCSGAENAHRVALVDDRIVGIIFMDGWAYRTWKFYIKRYWTILKDPLKIFMFFFRKFGKINKRFYRKPITQDDRRKIFSSQLPQKEKTINELQTMVDNGIRLLFIYTRSAYMSYNYKDQFKEMYKTLICKGIVEHYYLDKADHMYTLFEDRNYVINIIQRWLHKF